jgi:anaphase-promoting complex subunit 10
MSASDSDEAVGAGAAAAGGGGGGDESLRVSGRRDDVPVDMDQLLEIGSHAVWSVSSAKPGYGVDKLRDGSIDTFWQSDGVQPHLVNIQFNRRVALTMLAFYVDLELDESYTPVTVSVRAGTHFHDLEEVKLCDVPEPRGFMRIPLMQRVDDASDVEVPLRANLLQFAVLANNENGRDCHIRQIKIFGARPSLAAAMGLPEFERSANSKWAFIR